MLIKLINIRKIIFLTLPVLIAVVLINSVKEAALADSTEVNTSPYVKIQGSEDNSLSIEQHIGSDAFLIGTQVTVNKPIDGNVFIISGTAQINEKINGSVYAISYNNIEVKAPISNSLAFITRNVYISSIGEIEKDVYGITKNFILEGRIGNNLNLSFSPNSNIRISGKILGNFYYADTRPNITDNAYIQGETIKYNFWNQFELSDREMHEYTALKTFFFIIVTIIFGMFLILTKRDWVTKTTQNIRSNLIKDLFTGLLVIFIISITAFALLIMVFPFGYALTLFLSLLSAYYLSIIFTSILIGSFIISEKNQYSIIYKLITGLLIIAILGILPIINVLIIVISTSLFIGEMTSQYFSKTSVQSTKSKAKQKSLKKENS